MWLENSAMVSTPLRKGKTRLQCELVDYQALPSYLKDNEFILDYYRAEWPLKQTILSIFSVHNETLNIWTHLVGFFIFLALTLCTITLIQRETTAEIHDEFMAKLLAAPSSYSIILPASSDWHLRQPLAHPCSESNHTYPSCPWMIGVRNGDHEANMISSAQPIARWPFFTFLSGAMICLLASSACHLLSCHSKLYSYIMLRLDYTGISVLIVTSFYPVVYYSFLCHPFSRNLYIGFITVFGVAIVAVSLLPIFQTPNYRLIRTRLFFSMGVSALVPIVHKLVAFGHRPEALATTGYELVMGAFYVIGVAVYAARVPERWMPGRFDLAGHSHQLFHVTVVAGAYTHYLAGLVYLRWREMEGCF